jgi:hypothetical protein
MTALTNQIAADLPSRMRARADADALAADHELRVRADALDAAVNGFYGTPQTTPVSEFVRSWARARKAWCAYTGEPLL